MVGTMNTNYVIVIKNGSTTVILIVVIICPFIASEVDCPTTHWTNDKEFIRALGAPKVLNHSSWLMKMFCIHCIESLVQTTLTKYG